MGARFSAPVQTGPWAHPASCTMGTGSFLGVKSSRDVTLTSHPLLVPWSRKGRAICLLPLWAVWPVQSLRACTRVLFNFTFGHERVELYFYSPYRPYGLYRASVPVQGCTLPLPLVMKSRAIPLLPLWAVRPVQSLSAFTRVHFTFTLRITNSSFTLDSCIPYNFVA